jgi:hypothetical protein
MRATLTDTNLPVLEVIVVVFFIVPSGEVFFWVSKRLKGEDEKSGKLTGKYIK